MATLEGNLTTWRIADGILKTGRGREGDIQRDDLTGILKSVSYVEGVRDDGEKYAQVEANLEDENGDDIRVKASVGLSAVASNVTAFGFVAGLLECKEGDDIGIFPQQAAKAHEKYGVKPTFVTIGICAGGTRYKPVKVDRDDFAGATSREKFPHALAEFKRLPFYKEREKQYPDGADIAILRQIQADGIFPDPFVSLRTKRLRISLLAAKKHWMSLVTGTRRRKTNPFPKRSLRLWCRSERMSTIHLQTNELR